MPPRFAQLYDTNFERVYAYVASRVCDRDEAQDLTAEVFHHALAGIGRLGRAPRVISKAEPEYSTEARQAKHPGTVMLSLVVGEDGRPRNLHVQRSLGMGLDQKAIEAVKQWRFEPAMKDGHPVAVLVSVEVDSISTEASPHPNVPRKVAA
jgi:TonB family protein